MRGFGNWLKRTFLFLLTNADAVLAILVAAAVIAALATGEPSQHVVDAAILGLLGAVALAILRDRGSGRSLDNLIQLGNDAISDRPYEVVWQNNHWDLHDRHKATVKRTEQLRFTRNDVATNFEWGSGDGTVESIKASWRRSKKTGWIDARKVAEFKVRGGVKEIFCFDEEHSRGDMLDWCVVKETVDRFSSAHENVELIGRTKSDHSRIMRITWPRDHPPAHVEIHQGNQPARQLTVTTKDGRPYVEERVSHLGIGEGVRIAWTW